MHLAQEVEEVRLLDSGGSTIMLSSLDSLDSGYARESVSMFVLIPEDATCDINIQGGTVVDVQNHYTDLLVTHMYFERP